MRRTVAAGALLSFLALCSCGRAQMTPTITWVLPAAPAPGSLLLISGRGFARTANVRIGGQGAASVTWVNAQMLTAVVPLTAPPGPATVEVAAPLGGHASARAAVRIASTAAPDTAGGRGLASATPPGTATAPSAEATGAPAPAPAPAAATPPARAVAPAPQQGAPVAPLAPARGDNGKKGDERKKK